MFINSKPQKLFKPYVFSSGGLWLLTKIIFLKKSSIFDTGGQLETILYEKSGGKNRKKADFTAIIAAIFTFLFSLKLTNNEEYVK